MAWNSARSDVPWHAEHVALRIPNTSLLAVLALSLGMTVGAPAAQAGKGNSKPAHATKARTKPTKRSATAMRTPPVPPRERSSPRAGPSPCMTPDPGFGDYTTWEKLPIGQMIAPKKGGVTKDGKFDVVIHFHGHEAVRKEFVKTARGQVLVGIDLGIGSGAYEKTFEDPAQFERVIEQVEASMAKRSGRERCRVRRIALSSWSAGYGAVWRILMQPAGRRIDSLILLDSVHAGYLNGSHGQLKPYQLSPFVAYARRAAKGDTFMFLSHSAIQPPGYASTREVAERILKELGSTPRSAGPRRGDPLGLELYSRFDQGNLHVRGYGGNDKPDHCAHLGLMADVLKVHLNPRWRSNGAR